MSISNNSIVPELLLEVNVIKKTVTYRNVTKSIPDTYWNDVIIPALYPVWDSDKDKLVLFSWYSNNSYFAQRRKYSKNFKTGEFYWKDYEMENSADVDESASSIFELFKETFFLSESLENQEFQKEFAKIHAQTSSVSWLSVRLARNFLLDETDHVFVEDSSYSEEEKEQYKLYRKKLRDLPNIVETTDPMDVKFPISPRYFKELWLEKNPDTKYLETPEQFVPLASHYLMTFREKITSYLIVKNITESIYFDHFMDKIARVNISAVAPPKTSFSIENTDAASEVLNKLLEQLEAEKNG